MKVFSVLVLRALTCLTAAVPSCAQSAVNPDWEAIVVGGGPAGLSAASALGRVRRNALLIDSGEYRNQVTRRVHDVIGYDGIGLGEGMIFDASLTNFQGVTPSYFRWRARQQIAEYSTVHLMNGTVDTVEPQANNTYFTVNLHYDNGATSAVTARKVIIATGLRDVLPSTPGLQENFGKGIFWCPWCMTLPTTSDVSYVY